jgi:bifunctional DNA-binding transcriptional regulator/antitoxin component of YhaV-PrlF toxin-antitoxin module
VTRLSSKNQVTLPVGALRAAGVGVGDELRVEADGDGRLVLVREREPLDELIGSAPELAGAVDLQALRDEWER